MADQKIYFTKEHEWVQLQEGQIVRVGITEHAAQQLGDIVFIEYLTDLEAVDQGEEAVTVESVKSVSDVYVPVSGKILKQNPELTEHPERVNESPLEDGWMFEMELSDLDELESLLSKEEYETMIAEEE